MDVCVGKERTVLKITLLNKSMNKNPLGYIKSPGIFPFPLVLKELQDSGKIEIVPYQGRKLKRRTGEDVYGISVAVSPAQPYPGILDPGRLSGLSAFFRYQIKGDEEYPNQNHRQS